MSKPKIYKHNKKELTLEEMQELVGGYIQVLTSKDGKADIVIDEEGKLKSKSPNFEATKLWLGDNRDEWYDIIVGDAIICTGKARLS
tara:strand:- start:263 stop:523 length:261 start_codon:yes stop_codon:yes gene_type:complete